MLRLYDDRLTLMNEPHLWKLQIPLVCLEAVCEQVERDYLHLDDVGDEEICSKVFGLKVKKDF